MPYWECESFGPQKIFFKNQAQCKTIHYKGKGWREYRPVAVHQRALHVNMAHTLLWEVGVSY